MNRLGDWFPSVKGRQLRPFDLRPEDIDPEEIARALSNLCRFGGHLKQFYSVAQHSVLVASVLPDDLAFVGLLHDATEAYCGDMVRPIKSRMPEYKLLESSIWRVIAERFGLPLELPPEVKVADDRVLMTEVRDLVAAPAKHADGWPDAKPYGWIVDPWTAPQARRSWLERFYALVTDRVEVPHGKK